MIVRVVMDERYPALYVEDASLLSGYAAQNFNLPPKMLTRLKAAQEELTQAEKAIVRHLKGRWDELPTSRRLYLARVVKAFLGEQLPL